jgi:diacylglycerol kinase (ATP)
MRAAAILGLGCSPKHLKPFQVIQNQIHDKIEWQMGLPASAHDADVILLFGGDGTIHRHLAPLVRLGLPVLIVPAGSGNDFARALGLRRMRDSLEAWRKFCAGAENVRTIDLGVITPMREDAGKVPAPHDPSRDSGLTARYFCCVAGVGLDAEVSRRANLLPRWLRGNGGYVVSLLSMIFRFSPIRMRIRKLAEAVNQAEDASRSMPQINDADACWTIVSDQPTILAAFANTPTYGGGMKIAPQARMDDGLLDACVVGAVDPFKLFCMFPTVYGGRHLQIREVQYCQAARVRVETECPAEVYADGEFVCRTPVEVGIHSAALRVIVHSSQTSV